MIAPPPGLTERTDFGRHLPAPPPRLQVFCKNLNNMHSTFFDALMPKATVSGGAVYTLPQDIVTNHLVIRGYFQVWHKRASSPQST